VPGELLEGAKFYQCAINYFSILGALVRSEGAVIRAFSAKVVDTRFGISRKVLDLVEKMEEVENVNKITELSVKSL
jgi:hypothetical protein